LADFSGSVEISDLIQLSLGSRTTANWTQVIERNNPVSTAPLDLRHPPKNCAIVPLLAQF
jgi:hypothetical protein